MRAQMLGVVPAPGASRTMSTSKRTENERAVNVRVRSEAVRISPCFQA